MTVLARLAVLFGLRVALVPAATAPIVHRGEREIFAGAARLGRPGPVPTKLSREDAERLLGIPVRIIGR